MELRHVLSDILFQLLSLCMFQDGVWVDGDADFAEQGYVLGDADVVEKAYRLAAHCGKKSLVKELTDALAEINSTQKKTYIVDVEALLLTVGEDQDIKSLSMPEAVRKMKQALSGFEAFKMEVVAWTFTEHLDAKRKSVEAKIAQWRNTLAEFKDLATACADARTSMIQEKRGNSGRPVPGQKAGERLRQKQCSNTIGNVFRSDTA